MTTNPKDRRQKRILEAVRDRHEVTVLELSDRLSVSEVTVRRDLSELQETGTLRRVHGGAIATEPARPEPPVVQRIAEHEVCKDAIGRAAAALVEDGDAIFLGSGSTTAYVARHLVNATGLTVITNALTVAYELALAEGVTVVVAGGVMRASELSLVGHFTESAIRELRVDKVIIGMRAISLDQGMTNDYLPEVMTDRSIIEMTKNLILVADHTKFGRAAPAFVAPVEQVRTLVTDAGTDPQTLNDLKALGIRVVVANC